MILEVSGRAHSRRDDGAPQVYIAYVAVAPDNRRSCRSPRRLEGCGTALLEAAAEESRRLGWRGRVALHSLPGALWFYLAQGFHDRGPDPSEGACRYLERSDIL
jgi:GNAT superfamily N-acetyltransferase